MKLLRFCYMLPISLCGMFAFFLIVYASITWDDDDSSVWYWPNNPWYTDSVATYTKDDNFDTAICPPAPPPISGTTPVITGWIPPTWWSVSVWVSPSIAVYPGPTAVSASVDDTFP